MLRNIVCDLKAKRQCWEVERIKNLNREIKDLEIFIEAYKKLIKKSPRRTYIRSLNHCVRKRERLIRRFNILHEDY